MALHLIINGDSQTLDTLEAGASLESVLTALALAVDRIAVERNGSIVARRAWQQEALASGDRLEIVHFVGGGSSDA